MGSHTLYTYKVRMTESSYTQTFPVLQRSQFWSNYMAAIKGPLCAEELTYTPPQPSIWTQYRPVDITLYDLIYGSPPPLHQTVLPTLTHTGLSTQISIGSAGTELPGCGDFILEKKVKKSEN